MENTQLKLSLDHDKFKYIISIVFYDIFICHDQSLLYRATNRRYYIKFIILNFGNLVEMEIIRQIFKHPEHIL